MDVGGRSETQFDLRKWRPDERRNQTDERRGRRRRSAGDLFPSSLLFSYKRCAAALRALSLSLCLSLLSLSLSLARALDLNLDCVCHGRRKSCLLPCVEIAFWVFFPRRPVSPAGGKIWRGLHYLCLSKMRKRKPFKANFLANQATEQRPSKMY